MISAISSKSFHLVMLGYAVVSNFTKLRTGMPCLKTLIRESAELTVG